jgi:RNA polymerase sigma-70 factor (ECF subfamily)
MATSGVALALGRRRSAEAPGDASSTATTPPEALAARAEAAEAEARLLLEVARGDGEVALRELYRRYERRLFGLGLALLGDAGLAEELVQETFVRIWRRADRFDLRLGSASAFIFAVARRLAIDLWRRPSSRPIGPEARPDPAPDDEFDRVLSALTVREALGALSADHREVLELCYGGDLTRAEIAARLGLPVGTVKSRIHHALKAFRRALEDLGDHA